MVFESWMTTFGPAATILWVLKSGQSKIADSYSPPSPQTLNPKSSYRFKKWSLSSDKLFPRWLVCKPMEQILTIYALKLFFIILSNN
jgi:hypothetical protein